MFKRIVFVCLLIVGILMITMGVAGAQDKQLKFKMVSHGGSGNPFWTVVIKGMEDSCKLLNADCQWLGEEKFGLDAMAGYCKMPSTLLLMVSAPPSLIQKSSALA